MSNNVRVKIIGAGSIGNHLAYACRQRQWDVTVVDVSDASLRRMRDQIYPSRYGEWDRSIRLVSADREPRGDFDLIIVGTPPDTHMSLTETLVTERPRILLIEKPLCAPTIQNFFVLGNVARLRKQLAKDTMLLVGYNHLVTPAVQHLVRELEKDTVKNITVRWQESWKGIFNAHPWLSGPSDSYLGFTDRGGGASGEHSHGLNLCQYLAHAAGWGRVRNVKADLRFVEKDGCKYDAEAGFLLTTESGNKCDVFQDVLTEPAIKSANVVTMHRGLMTWHHRGEANTDTVVFAEAQQSLKVPMTRPADFKYEIDHVADLLEGKAQYLTSPLHINRGIETMAVLHAARKSSDAGGVSVDVEAIHL